MFEAGSLCVGENGIRPGVRAADVDIGLRQMWGVAFQRVAGERVIGWKPARAVQLRGSL